MRLHTMKWYAIGWTDAAPDVALCLDPRDLTFFFPFGGRFDTADGVEKLDSRDQVLGMIGDVHVPKIPDCMKGARVSAMRRKR